MTDKIEKNLSLKPPFLLVHLQHPDSEIVLDVTKINFIHKTGRIFYVCFAGTPIPMELPEEMGLKLWRLMRSSSITIHTESAAADDKNAETPSEQGFGDQPNHASGN
ncbi:hypothetical protein IQ244_20215 [Nostoc sp. LEGE 06077]|uniref:hypothetical protein n=1 Tax=Nostoc sp. LEGE 06077 TaxID=915325 RepID=UPI00187FBF5D|nr:hypothetical protein [Nostoc sp. LEGE 06077]MBE9208824.1 hypothetical protein [Nostoc sp. LEGE 06077]